MNAAFSKKVVDALSIVVTALIPTALLFGEDMRYVIHRSAHTPTDACQLVPPLEAKHEVAVPGLEGLLVTAKAAYRSDAKHVFRLQAAASGADWTSFICATLVAFLAAFYGLVKPNGETVTANPPVARRPPKGLMITIVVLGALASAATGVGSKLATSVKRAEDKEDQIAAALTAAQTGLIRAADDEHAVLQVMNDLERALRERGLGR